MKEGVRAAKVYVLQEGTEVIWTTDDGKTFTKEAEAIKHESRLEAREMLKAHPHYETESGDIWYLFNSDEELGIFASVATIAWGDFVQSGPGQHYNSWPAFGRARYEYEPNGRDHHDWEWITQNDVAKMCDMWGVPF